LFAATGWVAERVAIDGLTELSEDQAYRAMDFLLDALDEIAAEIFASVAHLLNLDLDIVFVDTTSTYWELECADTDPELADTVTDDETSSPTEAGTRRFGHSKDHLLHRRRPRRYSAALRRSLEPAMPPGGRFSGSGPQFVIVSVRSCRMSIWRAGRACGAGRTPLPYICHLIVLIRLTEPSTAPELWDRVRPLRTAASSRRRPLTKRCRSGWSSASTAAIQVSWRSPWRPTSNLGEPGDVLGKGIQAGTLPALPSIWPRHRDRGDRDDAALRRSPPARWAVGAPLAARRPGARNGRR
jgi:hypothetical protein